MKYKTALYFHHTLSMFSHYLGKVNSSNLLQITTEKRIVFDKNKTLMLSYGWIEIGVLFSTAYARSLRRSPARMHEDACAVSDALVDVTSHLLQTLLQFVSVVHPRLVHSLLDDAPDPVINRIKVRAVRWPKIRWTGMNAGVAWSRSRTVSRARCAGRCRVEFPKVLEGSARTYLRCGGKYYAILLKISPSFQQWKNFENRLRFEKVIAKSLVASFFWNAVYSL